MVDEEIIEAPDTLRERLTALLLTVPGWARNYTGTRDSAAWIIAEAKRVGWVITIVEAP